MELQYGATVGLQQHGPCGTEKPKESMHKTPKAPKTTAGDPPKDMHYYVQKLADSLVLMDSAEVGKVPEGEATEREEVERDLTMGTAVGLSETLTAKLEEGREKRRLHSRP